MRPVLNTEPGFIVPLNHGADRLIIKTFQENETMFYGVKNFLKIFFYP